MNLLEKLISQNAISENAPPSSEAQKKLENGKEVSDNLCLELLELDDHTFENTVDAVEEDLRYQQNDFDLELPELDGPTFENENTVNALEADLRYEQNNPDLELPELHGPTFENTGVLEEDLRYDQNDPDFEVPKSDDHISENEDTSEEEQGEQREPVEMRKRKRKAKISEWDREKSKLRRMKGKEYLGYTRTADRRVLHDKMRQARSLGPSCNSSKCIKYKNRFCNSMDEDSRKSIFEKFWELDWDQKKVYISCLMKKKATVRKFVPDNSRRAHTYEYYLRINNEVRQVCKKMFLSTLGVKEWMVARWCSQNTHGMHSPTIDINANRKQQRTPAPHLQIAKNQKSVIRTFLDKLPKMPSHYCRKDSTKLYLEADFGSKSNVYRIYEQYCKDNDEKPMNQCTFSEIFDEMNLGIFCPKKDQCNICVAYTAGNIDAQEYAKHIALKDAARKQKSDDKIKAESGEQHVFVMDVQAVKLCPVNNANKFYFKTKLKVHNFTIFNLATHQATNYWWNETEADLVASVFTSIIFHHLEKHCKDNLPIVLWSDGCPYQNRNVVLSNALCNYAVKYQKIVTQRYLEPGHTQMECDSVHSVLERKLKNQDILLPHNYVTITKNARIKPFPYDAEYLEHGFFKNYDNQDLLRYRSIRPGRKAGDPTVTNIRELSYTLDGKIKFKLDFSDDLLDLPQRCKELQADVPLQPLYQERLKIKKQKYDHLQDIKSTLPREVHHFYDNLPFD